MTCEKPPPAIGRTNQSSVRMVSYLVGPGLISISFPWERVNCVEPFLLGQQLGSFGRYSIVSNNTFPFSIDFKSIFLSNLPPTRRCALLTYFPFILRKTARNWS